MLNADTLTFGIALTYTKALQLTSLKAMHLHTLS